MFDGTRCLTLEDFGATADDIKDPEKLKAITQRILNSLHMTESEHDWMREHLHSTKWSDDKLEFINLVLEALSKFA